MHRDATLLIHLFWEVFFRCDFDWTKKKSYETYLSNENKLPITCVNSELFFIYTGGITYTSVITENDNFTGDTHSFAVRWLKSFSLKDHWEFGPQFSETATVGGREGFKERTNNSMETWLVCLSSSNHHVRFFQVWNYGEAVGRNLWPQKQHDSIPMKYDIDVYNLVHKIKYVTSPRLETNAAPNIILVPVQHSYSMPPL